jgi:hypothetical protein
MLRVYPIARSLLRRRKSLWHRHFRPNVVVANKKNPHDHRDYRAPDLAAPLTSVDFANNIDPVLAATAKAGPIEPLAERCKNSPRRTNSMPSLPPHKPISPIRAFAG